MTRGSQGTGLAVLVCGALACGARSELVAPAADAAVSPGDAASEAGAACAGVYRGTYTSTVLAATPPGSLRGADGTETVTVTAADGGRWRVVQAVDDLGGLGTIVLPDGGLGAPCTFTVDATAATQATFEPGPDCRVFSLLVLDTTYVSGALSLAGDQLTLHQQMATRSVTPGNPAQGTGVVDFVGTRQ